MNNIIQYILLVALCLCILSSCTSENNHDHNHSVNDLQAEENDGSHLHQIDVDSSRAGAGSLSPPRMAMADIGQTRIHIEYNAPSVRDRIIWGGLVGYDRVWVTGAHMATSIQFENAVRFNGQVVPAGKYALFTIPGRENWTVIVNENWDQHLADEYDQELDVLRIDVVPVQHEFTEQLTYNVISTDDGRGEVEFMWEELKITIPVGEL
jgi:hypothetical protein